MKRNALVMITVAGACSGPVQADELPPGFEVQTVASGFERPVGIAFAGDGRMFVAEQRGMVWVVEEGRTLPEPFIDLRDEVNGPWDRGLLGIALHPQFPSNRHAYLLYTVDPIFGEPDERPGSGAFGRLTRYTGTAASAGNVADPASRLVLLGTVPAEGIPVCDPSHTVGSVRFGLDGSLFVSAGDGAHFDQVDAGGLDPDCFRGGMFPPEEDIGAFRAQYLDSLAGKILRIDPATGLGLSTNPYWTGDASDNRSKVWASGLRNPYRVTVRPGSPPPGTLYIGDVGWFTFEEIDVATGGENFGWPCVEGTGPTFGYREADPAHSGCDTIPGPLDAPLAAWHHSNPFLSSPQGFTGSTALAGDFYRGECYPPPFDCAFFFADHSFSWIRALEVDDQDNLIALHPFAYDIDWIVDLTADPSDGDLHYTALLAGEVRRIRYGGAAPGDLDGDCTVDIVDLLRLLADWGPCPDPPGACPGDLDGDGSVAITDLLALLATWDS